MPASNVTGEGSGAFPRHQMCVTMRGQLPRAHARVRQQGAVLQCRVAAKQEVPVFCAEYPHPPVTFCRAARLKYNQLTLVHI